MAVPHLGFIVAAYAVTIVALTGTVVVLWRDRRAQQQALDRLSRNEP